MLKQILDHPRCASTDLSSLTNLSYGGAPMPFPGDPPRARDLPEVVRLRERVRPDRDHLDPDRARPGRSSLDGRCRRRRVVLRRLHSIGRPLPDVEIRSSTSQGNEMPVNQTGEILVRTPRVMKGLRGRGRGGANGANGFLHARPRLRVDDDGYSSWSAARTT